MYRATKRKQKGIMLSFVMLIVTIPGSLSCWSSSGDKNTDKAEVTRLQPLYNCSFSNDINPDGSLEVLVKNITNTTHVYCQVYLRFPENTTAAGYNDTEEILLCNELGGSFCARCSNDTGTMGSEEYDGNVTASCKQEETTTTEMPSTTMVSTTESNTNAGSSYGLNATYKWDGATTTVPDGATKTVPDGATTTVPDGATTIVSNGSLDRLQIALIVCAAVIVAILICAALIVHKRRKASKSLVDGKSQHQIEEENIRLKKDIGGLYTAVEKKQHGSQIVENVLYGSTTPEKGAITEELYTEVDKKQKTESG